LPAAGLDSNAVRIHLIGDDRLNAFVAGGRQLFINTGLLMRTDTPAQVMAVIAHEAGHITGGHLTRIHDQMRDSTAQAILGLLLGAAVAVATGNGGAGAAVIAGGQQAGMNSLLQYTRTQEAAADAAALGFLDRAGISSRGMLDVLQLLTRQEQIAGLQQDPYARTHPLSSERAIAISNHVALSRHSAMPDAPELVARHGRMRAKLIGFTRTIDQVATSYPQSDTSMNARYARAIATYRRGEIEVALPIVAGLIAAEPDNAYFHELHGQMLFETGRVEAALPAYRRAIELAPNEPLIAISLAQVEIEVGNPTLLKGAAERLNAALRTESDSIQAWRLLVLAEGRRGARGELALAQAELAQREGDKPAARSHAARASEILPAGSPAWQRAQDIRNQIK
jgi:predicted Zn-dependent protease